MIIDITDLTYSIDNKTIFNGVNLQIKENSITTIAGKNNSGKTTLLNLITSISISGILIDGKEKKDYTKEELDTTIQAVFPCKSFFKEDKVIDQAMLYTLLPKEDVSSIINELGLISTRKIELLTIKEKIKLQIACAIATAKKVVLIDELDSYFSNNEIKDILIILNECINKYNLTFVLTSTTLENTVYSDELFIINDGKVILYGDPLDVMSKDNIINKSGLKIPFMIDLSVKLKDYDLIEKIELNTEKLINNLWK